MDSLEKKLKELAILKRKKQLIDTGHDMKLDFIKLKPALEGLGVVAQRMREELADADLRSEQDDLDAIKFEWFLGYMRAKKEDLGLLVEEPKEKSEDYLECEKEDPTEEGEK